MLVLKAKQLYRCGRGIAGEEGLAGSRRTDCWLAVDARDLSRGTAEARQDLQLDVYPSGPVRLEDAVVIGVEVAVEVVCALVLQRKPRFSRPFL